MEIPLNLKYTKDHEWISMDGNIATVGITDFAQRELGDIVYIEVETIGETLNADDVFGTVEAVKTVSDLFLPMTGKIIEFNESLDSSPEDVNTDPYGNGWMVKVEIQNIDELDNLLSADQYKELIGEDYEPITTDWKLRYQMNLDLLKSGTVNDIATVVRALYHRSRVKELPILERKLYDNALTLLVDEIHFSLAIEKKMVEKMIFKKLELKID